MVIYIWLIFLGNFFLIILLYNWLNNFFNTQKSLGGSIFFIFVIWYFMGGILVFFLYFFIFKIFVLIYSQNYGGNAFLILSHDQSFRFLVFESLILVFLIIFFLNE